MWVWVPWGVLLLPKVPDLILTQQFIHASTVFFLWGLNVWKGTLKPIPKFWMPFLFVSVALHFYHWGRAYFSGVYVLWPLWGLLGIALFTLWLTVPFDVQRTRTLITWALLAVSIHIFLGALGGTQFLKDGLQPSSVFGNPMNAGLWLCLGLPWIQGKFRIPIRVLVSMAIFITHSTVALLGWAVWIGLSLEKRHRLLGLGLAFAGLLYGTFTFSGAWEVSNKLSLISPCWNAFLQNHITGAGFSMFRELSLRSVGSSAVWAHPFSLPLRLLVEGGALGVAAAVVSFYLMPFKEWFASLEKRTAFALFGLVCAISIGGSDLPTLLLGTWWMNLKEV